MHRGCWQVIQIGLSYVLGVTVTLTANNGATGAHYAHITSFTVCTYQELTTKIVVAHFTQVLTILMMLLIVLQRLLCVLPHLL